MRRKIHRAPMAVASALLLGVFATACSTEDPTDVPGTETTSESDARSPAEEASESSRRVVRPGRLRRAVRAALGHVRG